MVVAWLYVVLMVAVMQSSLVAGVVTFLFFGILPCGLVVWLIGTPARRHAAAQQKNASQLTEVAPELTPDKNLNTPDRGDTERN